MQLHWSIATNNTCGDGFRDSLEACDDGNHMPGDGCSEQCSVEAAYQCTVATGQPRPDACFRVYNASFGQMFSPLLEPYSSKRFIIHGAPGSRLRLHILSHQWCSLGVQLKESGSNVAFSDAL
jgi:cysteine-rich repeat protein